MDPEAPGCAAGAVGCLVVLRFRPVDCRGAVAAGVCDVERKGPAGGEGDAWVRVSV